jgi:flagellar hook assembly protein FlgD
MKNVFKIIFLSLIIAQTTNSFAQTNGTLTFKATTLNQSGTYAPRNVMAIWITNSTTGAFVKTLKREAQARVSYLTKWKASSASNVTDAVVGATLNSHQAHTVTWNGKNVSQVVVPDADYKVWIEFTEGDYTGPSASFVWTKGPTAQTLTPTNAAFSNISIQWVPNVTNVEEETNTNNVSVYPNPFSDQLNFVIENSNENCLVDIYDITGKKVAHLSQLPTSLVKNIITWNGVSESGDQLNNGIYFYSINIGTKKYSGKVLLSK